LITQSPSVKDGVLPADGPGAEGFSNLALLTLLTSGPCLLSWLLSLSWLLTILIALLTFFPVLASFWYLSSRLTPRRNEKVKLPDRPIESYLNFLKNSDRQKYRGRNKIPIDTFQTLYFNGDVEFKGDCLEVLEYRHDWASFHFTFNIFKFFLFSFVPEVILHTRSQGKISFSSSHHLASE
jgi:sphingolipid C9-methyltransferase